MVGGGLVNFLSSPNGMPDMNTRQERREADDSDTDKNRLAVNREISPRGNKRRTELWHL